MSRHRLRSSVALVIVSISVVATACTSAEEATGTSEPSYTTNVCNEELVVCRRDSGDRECVDTNRLPDRFRKYVPDEVWRWWRDAGGLRVMGSLIGVGKYPALSSSGQVITNPEHGLDEPDHVVVVNPNDPPRMYKTYFFERRVVQQTETRVQGMNVGSILRTLGQIPVGPGAQVPVASPTDAPSTRAFSETGQSLSNAFLASWTQFGGISKLGYPISGAYALDGTTFQITERARLEWHPNAPVSKNGNGTNCDYRFSLSQLGPDMRKVMQGKKKGVQFTDEPASCSFGGEAKGANGAVFVGVGEDVAYVDADASAAELERICAKLCAVAASEGCLMTRAEASNAGTEIASWSSWDLTLGGRCKDAGLVSKIHLSNEGAPFPSAPCEGLYLR